MTPAPSTSHQRVSGNLEHRLREHVRQHRLGAVLHAPVDVILADDTVVQPDIVFVAQGRRGIVTERAIEGPPDLVVEILSKGTRRLDRTVKMRAYAGHGVRECWIVDPEARTLERFELSGGIYALVQAASGREEIVSPLFPGLALTLDEIFAPDFA